MLTCAPQWRWEQILGRELFQVFPNILMIQPRRALVICAPRSRESCGSALWNRWRVYGKDHEIAYIIHRVEGVRSLSGSSNWEEALKETGARAAQLGGPHAGQVTTGPTTLINKIHALDVAAGIKSKKSSFSCAKGLKAVLECPWDELMSTALEVIISQIVRSIRESSGWTSNWVSFPTVFKIRQTFRESEQFWFLILVVFGSRCGSSSGCGKRGSFHGPRFDVAGPLAVFVRQLT